MKDKPTRFYDKTGVGFSYIQIKLEITQSTIIDTIVHLLLSDKPVNKTNIKSEVRVIAPLQYSNDGFNWTHEMYKDDYDKTLPKATELAKRYFPDYFLIYEKQV